MENTLPFGNQHGNGKSPIIDVLFSFDQNIINTSIYIEAFPLHIATFHDTRWEFGVFMGFLDAESTRILPKFHGLPLVVNLPIASLLYIHKLCLFHFKQRLFNIIFHVGKKNIGFDQVTVGT